MRVACKELTIKHIPSPPGVHGKNSDNRLIYEKFDRKLTLKFIQGIGKTYPRILERVEKSGKVRSYEVEKIGSPRETWVYDLVEGKLRSEDRDQRTEVRSQKACKMI